MDYRIAGLDWEYAERLYHSGESLSSIGRTLDCSYGAVRNNLIKRGVNIDSKRRADQSGSNNPAFKDGLSRATINRLTKKVLQQAGYDLYTCQQCGKVGDRPLDRHHKDHDRSSNTVENLEILCVRCHNSGWSGAKHPRAKDKETGRWV